MTEVVSREEFEEAMAKLGLVKCCEYCGGEVDEGSHWYKPCQGYEWRWRHREEGEKHERPK